MNPIVQSILTTVGASAAATIATWAVGVGIIPQSSSSSVENALLGLGLYAVAGALTWLKTLSHTQVAQIAAVNAANNGVKVVAATVAAPVAEAPIVTQGRSTVGPDITK